MASLAVGLSLVESAFPSPIPGVKPGLANIIVLLVLHQDGLRAATWVSVLRVIAGSLFFWVVSHADIFKFKRRGLQSADAGAHLALAAIVVWSRDPQLVFVTRPYRGTISRRLPLADPAPRHSVSGADTGHRCRCIRAGQRPNHSTIATGTFARSHAQCGF